MAYRIAQFTTIVGDLEGHSPTASPLRFDPVSKRDHIGPLDMGAIGQNVKGALPTVSKCSIILRIFIT